MMVVAAVLGFNTGPRLRRRLRMGGVGDKRQDFKIA
jgi:hypothetical protein